MTMLKLEEIIPAASSFKLKKTGKTYDLNPVTMADEMWLKREFGDKLGAILTQGEIEPICRIVFRLLTDESRMDLARREVTFMDEQGNTLKKEIGGVELLFWCVVGWEEKQEILMALLQTIGISRPMVEKLSREEEEKKSPIPALAGVTSLTPSLSNTDGPPTTS